MAWTSPAFTDKETPLRMFLLSSFKQAFLISSKDILFPF
jgi:hypothetical protein